MKAEGIIALSTTTESMEILKARTTRNKLKDLVGNDFKIENIVFFQTDEENGKRMNVSILVEGQYYRGISNRVIDILCDVMTWVREGGDLGEMKFSMQKSSGRYGVLDLMIL